MKLTFDPFFVEKPWGGDFIARRFNLLPSVTIGEAFLLSTLKNYENIVGTHLLSDVLKLRLPYLVKFIDAKENLSVQVHPNDHFSQILESSSGKTECWIITEALENSGIYLGLKDKVTLDDFFNSIESGSNIVEKLNFIPVKKNDFIIVPAGTIHAIGAGVRLLEFQQSSGITYRIWDWGRANRELHLEKSRLVCNKNQNPIQITDFESLPIGAVCFEHSDFKILKIATDRLKCSANPNSYSLELNLTDFSYSLNQDSGYVPATP